MIRKIIVLIIFLVFVWLIWSSYGRNHPLSEPETFLTDLQTINPSDSLERTVIGMQPYMLSSDYLDQAVFKQKIRGYFQAAFDRGMFKKESIVLLPEFLGTWLVIEGEKHAIAKKETLEEAMAILISSNLGEFGLSIINTGDEEDWTASAIFRMKAKKMANTYFLTFSELAKEFNTYIVAGSIVLPGPTVIEGKLFVDLNEELRNASFIFNPDGEIVGEPIFKAFPIESEQSFITGADPSRYETFDLPIGKTAVLICADSWYPESYKSTNSQRVELILVPSYCPGDESMSALWQGYSGYEAPKSTDLSDIGRITEQQAWEKYALPGQIKNTAAQTGMNVFLRGELWDLGTDGQPMVIQNGELISVDIAEKGGIWALNF